ncbi:TPR end-of-group domain-containing protein [Bacterioplanoides pacificum]|uniref:TPR end-of-group domain-containing protein n=1 Tax=Bacterioplanoides pacificum TaxID=1171596 RepID=A0ABV7VQ14_9GAMM
MATTGKRITVSQWFNAAGRWLALCGLLLACALPRAEEESATSLQLTPAQQALLAEQLSQSQRDQLAKDKINNLDAKMYSPFTELYILGEVKDLRQEIANTRVELTEKIVAKELTVADRALVYATDTITYFFYLLAGASSLLVIIGWNSLRDVKERVGTFANEEIGRITSSYEERLANLEKELHRKSRHIKAAQDEIELTNEIHSLWLKASQENSPQNKISLYDQILALRPDDIEALTYKADAALLLGQTEWATSLANRALEIDPENSHAFFQRACAFAESGFVDEALRDLAEAIQRSESLRIQAGEDTSFESLHDNELFREMVVMPEKEESNVIISD